MDLGSEGVWGAILIVSFKKRVTRKFRIIILLHLGLVTFLISFWENPKTLIFMIFRIFDVSMIPKNLISCWHLLYSEHHTTYVSLPMTFFIEFARADLGQNC